MVWYNPTTWFGSEEEQPAPPVPAAPMGGPYGGKKRKTRRGKKARSKTGRRKH
jgi:hypothetical protein